MHCEVVHAETPSGARGRSEKTLQANVPRLSIRWMSTSSSLSSRRFTSVDSLQVGRAAQCTGTGP